MDYPTGQALIADIEKAQPTQNHGVVWWLGQHSFVLRLADVTIYIDPFLSDHGKRRIPPLLTPEEITNADIVIGTHDHRDHIDREMWPGIAAASPQATFVVPELHRDSLIEDLSLPPDRLVGIDDGTDITVKGIDIHGVASAHEFLHRDPDTGLHPFMGVLIRAGTCTVYHAGDTCLYDGLLDKLRDRDLQAALLPINGRDAERLARNCIGNMTFQEAADLAGQLKPGLTLPAHFDMFMGNMEDPRLFTDYMRVKYPELHAMIPEYGRAIQIG